MGVLLPHSFHNPHHFMLSYLICLHNNISFSERKIGIIGSSYGSGHIKLNMHLLTLSNKFLRKLRITKGRVAPELDRMGA